MRHGVLLIAALVLGGFAGYWLAYTDVPPAPPQDSAPAEALARLQQDLAASEQVRARLQQQLTRLETQLSSRAGTASSIDSEHSPQASATDAARPSPDG